MRREKKGRGMKEEMKTGMSGERSKENGLREKVWLAF